MLPDWPLYKFRPLFALLLPLLLGVVAVGQAFGQNRWTWRNPLPQGSSLNSIVHADGRYIATGDSGTLLTSPDAATWTARATGMNRDLHGTAHGSGIFVAVGAQGAVLRSTDSVHWTFGNSGTTEPLRGVTFGEGLFIAVGGDSTRGVILTSGDGVQWTTRVSNAGAAFYAVTHGNGRFVAVGHQNLLYTSDDGIAWTSLRPTGNGVSLNTVTYGNGLFVVGGFGGLVQTSPDGATWTTRVSNTPDHISALSFGGGRFSGAVSVNTLPTSGAIFSTDGINWTHQPIPLTTRLGLVATATSAAGDVSIFGGDAGLILSSRNQTSWDFHGGPSTAPWKIVHGNGAYLGMWGPFSATATAPGKWTFHRQPAEFLDVTYGNGRFAAVTRTSIHTSTDGITWTSPYTGLNSTITSGHSIEFSNGRFIATSVNNVVISSDGLSWTASTTGNSLRAGAYANGTYVVVGGASNVSDIRTSTTGTSNWIARSTGASDGFTDVVFGNGLFVAVGFSGKIYTSPDGLTWTSRVSGTNGFLRSIAWGDGMFVVAGYSGLLLTSPDGITWTDRTLPTNADLLVAFTGSDFICGGEQVASSPDGIQWSFQTEVREQDFHDVTYGGGLFVAASRWTNSILGSTIVTSANGISWTPRTKLPFLVAGVGYANGLYFAGGDNGRFFTSPNGLQWTEKSAGGTFAARRMAYGNGAYVIAGGSFGQAEVHHSTDGVAWTKLAAGLPGSEIHDLVFANGLFVAVGGWSSNHNHIIATSPDGITWTNRKLPGPVFPDEPLKAIAHGNGMFVTVGDYGRIAVSSDGVNWTTSVGMHGDFTTRIDDIVFADGRFVAVRGYSGEVLISTDGVKWVSQSALGGGGPAITYGSELFVHVGQFAAIRTSPREDLPPAPGNVILSPQSSRGIQITWQDAAAEAGYLIERRTEPSGTWQVIAPSLPADTNSFADGNLTPGGTYSYRLRTFYPGGASDYSDLLAARTFTVSEQWRHDHFSTTADEGSAADSADPDQDGTPNLLERAFSLPPLYPIASGYPQVSKSSAYRLQFVRDSANTDLAYEVDSATELQQWTMIARSTGGSATVAVPSGAATISEQPMDGTKIMVTISLSSKPRLFLRVRVTRQ